MRALATVTPATANVSHTPYFDDCTDLADERMALMLAYQQGGAK